VRQVRPARRFLASKARKLRSMLNQVFTAVESSPILLDMLEIATSPARKVIFFDTLVKLEHLPTAFLHLCNKSPASDDLFNLFTAGFGDFPNSKTIFSRIDAALQHRQQFILETRFNKRLFVIEVGLDWTEEVKTIFFSTEVISAYDFILKFSFLS
jgi:hypothetical protein